MRILKRVFWIVILLAAAAFAIVNMTNEVTVRFDPFERVADGAPASAFSMPLPVLLLLFLAGGLIVGVILENDRGRAVRRELRREQKRRKELETELSRLNETLKAADHPDSAGLPVVRR
ncbi:MAG: hypothetical protein MRY74_07940 [Neomegalonema sp.]|nr:hypothetical protein [Neomegalonema sp.]